MLVNINTALASITKPSAINTEEWSQLGIGFNWGHYNCQAPPHPFFSFARILKMNFIINAPVLSWLSVPVPPYFSCATVCVKSKMQM